MMAEFLDQSQFIVLQILNKWFYYTAVSRAQGQLRFPFKLCHLREDNPSEFYKVVGKLQASDYSLDSWPTRFKIKGKEDDKDFMMQFYTE